MRSRPSGFLPALLPKSTNETPPEYYIAPDILDQASAVLDSAQQSHLTLKPGIKFCRNYCGTIDQAKNIRVLDIKPRGSAELLGTVTDQRLSHSIFIHKKPEELTSAQASHTELTNDELGVYLLCASQTKKDAVGIGYRDRSRCMTESDEKKQQNNIEVANCVVKYMLYLGTVSDLTNKTEAKNITPLLKDPQWAVYKRRVWLDTLKSDNTTAEVMPYLGPSLSDVAREQNVAFSEKINMCVKFFTYIASEYDKFKKENPTDTLLGFYDIKPDNFSYDLHHTKECVQNDTKARQSKGGIYSLHYLPPWMKKKRNKQKLTTSAAAPRDLYAMGKSMAQILTLHNDSSKPASGRNIPSDIAFKKLQKLYLEKIANDIKKHAEANQTNHKLDNAAYIRETIIPALEYSQTQDDILFMSAVSYVKEKEIDIQPANLKNIASDATKKNIFTCAVFGAKAYLDRHEAENLNKSTGKNVVNAFLKNIANINPEGTITNYTNEINEAIKNSVKASRFFSKKSRHHIFKTYCPFFSNNTSTIQRNETDHIHEATAKRINKLVRLKDTDTFDRAMFIFLSNDNENLRFKVLEKAIQYLESDKGGWFGKKMVRNLIENLCDHAHITDKLIVDQVGFTIGNKGFFSRNNKTRREFFEKLLPTTGP